MKKNRKNGPAGWIRLAKSRHYWLSMDKSIKKILYRVFILPKVIIIIIINIHKFPFKIFKYLHHVWKLSIKLLMDHSLRSLLRNDYEKKEGLFAGYQEAITERLRGM